MAWVNNKKLALEQTVILEKLEMAFRLQNDTEAALLLGIDRRRYSEYKNGHKTLKPWLLNSIDAHCQLNGTKKNELLKTRGIR